MMKRHRRLCTKTGYFGVKARTMKIPLNPHFQEGDKLVPLAEEVGRGLSAVGTL
jgi:hypothetical protein